MSDSRRPPGQSSPHSYRLPSLSSISGDVNRSGGSIQARRASLHEAPSDDLAQSLRQQIASRDHTIASLRVEQGRVQSVCDQLDTKSQVMDRELAALTEERSELRKQASALAIQVEKLTRDKEQLQNQSQADAAQWRQIMSMSSKLQMQNVEESRRFNLDRETWAREREKLEQRITTLQGGGVLQRIDTQGSSDTSMSLETPRRTLTMTVSSMSEDQLRQEVASLRERCQELEELLSAVSKEAASVERTGVLLREARRRLAPTMIIEERTAEGERKRPRA